MQNIEAIAEACQKGNLEKFGEIFDAFHEKIYRFVFFRTHHKQTAEDITSVVFTKALEKIHSFNPQKGNFSSWLYQIARNSIIDHYRSRKETQNLEDAFDISTPSSLEKDTDTALKLEEVKKYMQGLAPEQRNILIMRVWDGLSHKEIAAVLNITESASKMAFSRVMSKLNKDLMPALLYLIIFYEFYGKLN